MKQTLIIGDIHGCYYELQALLDKAGLNAGDEVVGIGDVVDRGPETPQVVTFFQETPYARTIMGNHDHAVLYEPSNFNSPAEQASYWTRMMLETEPDPVRATRLA